MKIFFGGFFAINVILSFLTFASRGTNNSLVDRVPLFVDYIWIVSVAAVIAVFLMKKAARRT